MSTNKRNQRDDESRDDRADRYPEWSAKRGSDQGTVPVRVKFSERYLTVAEANRRNYEKQARHYLKHAACVNQEYDQGLLAHDLERAVRELSDLGRPPVALDACGGAGNAALKLQALGCDAHLVDISPHMVEIYRQ